MDKKFVLGIVVLLVMAGTAVLVSSAKPPACYDYDGGNFPETPGFVWWGSGNFGWDACVDDTTLREWYCFKSTAKYVYRTCADACQTQTGLGPYTTWEFGYCV